MEIAPISSPPGDVADHGRAEKRMPGLDGIRMIAISLVILLHAYERQDLPADGWLGPICKNGGFGVGVFFVLSGFLITHLLVREEMKTGGVALKEFFVRRFLRILPPAYFYLAIVAVLAAVRMVPMPWSDLPPSLLFYVNYHHTSAVTGHYWSLSIEEQFYLIWPLVFILCRHNRIRIVVATLAVIAAPIWRQFSIHLAGRAELINWSRFDLRYDPLLVGCLLAVLIARPRTEAVLGCRWLRGDRSVLLFVATIAATFHEQIQSLPLVRIVIPTARFVLVALIINRVIRSPRGRIVRALEFGPVAWMGRLSYSLYLWQQLFTKLPAGGWMSPRFPLNLAPILFASMFSYYVIERPLMRLRSRFRPGGSHLPKGTGADAAESPASTPPQPR